MWWRLQRSAVVLKIARMSAKWFVARAPSPPVDGATVRWPLSRRRVASPPPHSCYTGLRGSATPKAVTERRLSAQPFAVRHSRLAATVLIILLLSYTLQCVCAPVSNKFVSDFVLNIVNEKLLFFVTLIISSGVSYSHTPSVTRRIRHSSVYVQCEPWSWVTKTNTWDRII